jgi:hypothetical protein
MIDGDDHDIALRWTSGHCRYIAASETDHHPCAYEGETAYPTAGKRARLSLIILVRSALRYLWCAC